MTHMELDRIAKRCELGFTPTAEEMRELVRVMHAQSAALRALTERVDVLAKEAEDRRAGERALLATMGIK